MNKNDKRFQNTEQAIRSAFIHLCETKGAARVTVTDICKEADINRGTFYLHYETLEDLLDALENENAERLIAASDLYHYDTASDELVDYLFDLISENREDFRFYLYISTGTGAQRYEQYLKEKTLPAWLAHSQLNEYEAELVFSFIMQGGMAIIREWFRNDCRDTERVKYLFSEMIKHGLYSQILY